MTNESDSKGRPGPSQVWPAGGSGRPGVQGWGAGERVFICNGTHVETLSEMMTMSVGFSKTPIGHYGDFFLSLLTPLINSFIIELGTAGATQ